MSKTRTRFICDRCGHESAQWHGKCPACGEWNTLVEVRAPENGSRPQPEAETSAVAANAVDLSGGERTPTGIEELDRVLGGGLVAGAVVLLAGDPGIGKSTLLLQAARSFAAADGSCLYVSGEESLSQVVLRGRRLGAVSEGLLLLAETDVEAVAVEAGRRAPGLLIADSVQAMWSSELASPPGTVSQVRECAGRLLRLAKEAGIPTILVGHVTKEGSVAGPRLLEHMVDTVLTLEGDRHSGYRVLRSAKNRFGSTEELGLFRMTGSGLEGVPDASAALLAERRGGTPGSSVAASLEGSRPLLVEVQALTTQAGSNVPPRRSVTGLDYGRVCLILAVLEKRAGVPLGTADVFVNVPGGIRVGEPAADLAVALALASSWRDEALPAELACVGEVGLTGEIRSVPQLGRRLAELARQGFRRCLVPKQGEADEVRGTKVVAVESLADAFRAAFAG